jgi:phosphotriesterase-related protein
MDMAKNIYWKSYGGQPGLNFLIAEFQEKLKEWGMIEYFEKLFFSTPAKLFSFKK